MTTTTIAPDRTRSEGAGARPSARPVLTVHAGVSLPLRLALLDAVEKALESQGVERARIDERYRSELVVLAELEEG